jgi:EAL domain-containing protein (putative c-di-GMP-specific phosphodiesterase class I)
VVPIQADSTDISGLLRNADAACYMAKEMGRNSVYVSHAHDQVLGDWRGEVQWAADIQLAMQEQRLVLHCQTIERLDRHASDGSCFELLLRMTDDNGDAISPQTFIPSAERYDQMIKLDRWVISQAFQWLAEDRKRLAGISLCAINLSGQSLLDKTLYEYIIKELRRQDLPAHKICFEISEAAVISRLDRCVVLMGLLKEIGFRFALDDFGIGMSSFSSLKQLPLDFLKIDGSIVMSILEDPVNRSMVGSINEIAHMMGLQTIAKYVENDWIRFELKKIGVDYVQGFGVARPEPLLQAVAL